MEADDVGIVVEEGGEAVFFGDGANAVEVPGEESEGVWGFRGGVWRDLRRSFGGEGEGEGDGAVVRAGEVVEDGGGMEGGAEGGGDEEVIDAPTDIFGAGLVEM